MTEIERLESIIRQQRKTIESQELELLLLRLKLLALHKCLAEQGYPLMGDSSHHGMN